jgi:hypothetical protein
MTNRLQGKGTLHFSCEFISYKCHLCDNRKYTIQAIKYNWTHKKTPQVTLRGFYLKILTI